MSQTRCLMKHLFLPDQMRIFLLTMSVAIGLSAMFAIANFLRAIKLNLYENSRNLIAADLTISSWRPFTPQQQTVFTTTLAPQFLTGRMIQFSSMVQDPQDHKTPFLVTVKAVDSTYPFYGTLQITSPTPMTIQQLKSEECLIARDIADLRGLKVGESLKIGWQKFTIVGIVDSFPDQLFNSALQFAPQIIISVDDVSKTKLIQFGSRIKYLNLYAFKPGRSGAYQTLETLKADLLSKLDTSHLTIKTFREAANTTKELFDRITTYFTWVSIIGVTLGCMGLILGLLSFINDQLPQIATLRCMGVSGASIKKAYLLLCLIIGFIAAVIAAGLGYLLDVAFFRLLESYLAIPFGLSFSWFEFAEILLIASCLGAGLNYFSIQALVRVPPHAVFTHQMAAVDLSRGEKASIFASSLLLTLAYLFYRTRSIQLSLLFVAMLLLTFLLCFTIIWLAMRQFSWLSTLIHRPFILRHAILSTARNQYRSFAYLLALSIGISLIATIHMMEISFLEALKPTAKKARPNLFLVDIDPPSSQAIKKLAERYTQSPLALSALIRARLTHINRQPISKHDLPTHTTEQKNRLRFLTREYNLTYKDQLNASETITAGRFWAAGSTAAEVSLEVRFARRVGVDIGDQMTFDIQGRPISVTVTSLRRINWLSLMPNFFVLMPTHILGGAPQTLIGSLSIKRQQDLVAMQRDLIGAYPHVSVLNMQPLFAKMTTLFGYLGFFLQLLALLCGVVGIIILVSTLNLERKNQIQRWQFLKTIGMATRRIYFMALIEYGLIGLVTCMVVLPISLGLSYFIMQQMDISLTVTANFVILYLLAPLCFPVLVGILYTHKDFKNLARAEETAR